MVFLRAIMAAALFGGSETTVHRPFLHGELLPKSEILERQ